MARMGMPAQAALRYQHTAADRDSAIGATTGSGARLGKRP